MQGVIRNAEKKVDTGRKTSEAIRASKLRANIAVVMGALFLLGIFVVMQVALLESFTEQPGHEALIGGDEQEPEKHSWLGPLMKERLKRKTVRNSESTPKPAVKSSEAEDVGMLEAMKMDRKMILNESIVRSVADLKSTKLIEKRSNETAHESLRSRAATAASGEPKTVLAGPADTDSSKTEASVGNQADNELGLLSENEEAGR